MNSKRTISYTHYWTVFTDTCWYCHNTHMRIPFHRGGHQLSPHPRWEISRSLWSLSPTTHTHTHTHTLSLAPSRSLSFSPYEWASSVSTHLPRVTERRLRRLVEERKAERVRVLELPASRVGRGYTCDTVQAKAVVAGAALWVGGGGVGAWERGSGGVAGDGEWQVSK